VPGPFGRHTNSRRTRRIARCARSRRKHDANAGKSMASVQRGWI
jgi:hypothetical protein